MKLGLVVLASLMSLTAFAATEGEPAPVAPSLTTQVTIDGATPLTVLASSFGQTLYVFDPDQAAGKPACNAKCAEVWPPITVSADEIAALNNPDLGVQLRDGGLNQLTYKGSPVYQFNLDRVAGDIKGDGIGGVWHIITL